MSLYRKKPVVIEAKQYTYDNLIDLTEWIGSAAYTWWDQDAQWHLEIQTLEGNMEVSLHDFVIRGVQGEFYPCKPDIFAATYEPVLENS